MAEKVLVLGGGFAGLESALLLRKNGLEVTLVSDRDYVYIYPISIWIPTREIDFEDACFPLKEITAKTGITFIVSPVTSIDAEQREVRLQNEQTLTYDYLVLALGADKTTVKGIEHTCSICGSPDAVLSIRDKLDDLIEKGHGHIAVGFGGNPNDPSAVRGGPAFEFMFNVHNLLKQKGVGDNFKLTMFAPMPKPGIRLGEKAYAMMTSWFDKLGINRQYGIKIREFRQNEIIFADDSSISADLIMFIAAGKGHNILMNSTLPQNKAGFLRINDHCQVIGYNNIFAVGDSAALDGPDWKAKQGHLAEVMARVAAKNIISLHSGKQPSAGYQKHLSVLCVMDFGNGAAYVYRDGKKAKVTPLPIVGHWLKKGWGHYWKLSKAGKIPRLPGM